MLFFAWVASSELVCMPVTATTPIYPAQPVSLLQILMMRRDVWSRDQDQKDSSLEEGWLK